MKIHRILIALLACAGIAYAFVSPARSLVPGPTLAHPAGFGANESPEIESVDAYTDSGALSSSTHTVQAALHQWIVRDWTNMPQNPGGNPAPPGGYSYVWVPPPPSQTPVSIEIRYEVSGYIWLWAWENLSAVPTVEPILGATRIQHVVRGRNGNGELIDHMREHRVYFFYNATPFAVLGEGLFGLQPYDGVLDFDGPSGDAYQCPGSPIWSNATPCSGGGMSGDTQVVTIQWDSIRPAVQQMWLNGTKALEYRPEVDFCPDWLCTPDTNVSWETDHGWVNGSDVKVSTKIHVTFHYQ